MSSSSARLILWPEARDPDLAWPRQPWTAIASRTAVRPVGRGRRTLPVAMLPTRSGRTQRRRGDSRLDVRLPTRFECDRRAPGQDLIRLGVAHPDVAGHSVARRRSNRPACQADNEARRQPVAHGCKDDPQNRVADRHCNGHRMFRDPVSTLTLTSRRNSRDSSLRFVDAHDIDVEPLRTLRTRRKRGKRCVELLRRRYGSPSLNNKDDALDELVFIILSQMTTSPSYERVYSRLKAAMPHWRSLTRTSIAELRSLIADAGLSGQRALRLKRIADRLVEDFGEVSLATVTRWENDAVQRYLTSLPGVGVKTAKCVMMYSLGRQVLPVDTHTARVASRLGLVSAGGPEAVDRNLSDVIPPPLRFDFHVNAVAHGRAVCRAVRPRCDDCVLTRVCPVGRIANRSTRGR